MAAYIRFEIYLPTYYRDQNNELVYLPDDAARAFVSSTQKAFGSFSEWNPVGATPIRGSWSPRPGVPPVLDHLRLIIVLVPEAYEVRALGHFKRWKPKLEKQLHQQIVAIQYWPVNVFGEL